MFNAEKITELLNSYMPDVLAFGIKVLIGIVALILGKFVIKIITKIIDKILRKLEVEISVIKFFKSLIRTVFYVVLIILILTLLGVPIASFIAVLGSAGLAIGLAMQGSLANFAGGVLILILHPFRVGDYIIDGSTGKEGTVDKIDLFYTTIITIDNKCITIPNGTLANSDITNATAMETRRLDIPVGISYNSDIKLAKDTLFEIINSQEKVHKDKGIKVFVKELADSAVILELRVWVNTEDYWDLKFLLNEIIKLEYDKIGIEIPYNQLEVYINNREA